MPNRGGGRGRGGHYVPVAIATAAQLSPYTPQRVGQRSEGKQHPPTNSIAPDCSILKLLGLSRRLSK